MEDMDLEDSGRDNNAPAGETPDQGQKAQIRTKSAKSWVVHKVAERIADAYKYNAFVWVTDAETGERAVNEAGKFTVVCVLCRDDDR